MYQQESFSSAFWRGFNRIPVVIRVVIGISVILFLFQALFGRIQIDGLSLHYYIVQYLGFDPSFKTAITQPWRFVTYIFLHGSGFHLLFTMLCLWWMGRLVEEQIGPCSFAVLFFGSGLGGAIFHIAFSFLYGTSHVIGASGAVFGVMVAFASLFPRILIMLIFLPPIEARYVVAGLIAFDVLLLGSGDNIARLVHLGGAFTGYQLIKARSEEHTSELQSRGQLVCRLLLQKRNGDFLLPRTRVLPSFVPVLLFSSALRHHPYCR